MINEDWYWPGLERDKLGVRISVSDYLPYLIPAHRLRASWEESLRREVALVTSEALSIDSGVIGWDVEISQVGSAAQEAHAVFVWFQEIPRELLTGLLVVGAERSLAAIYGHLKRRITSIRKEVNGKEITASLEFHSATLVELCIEHAVRKYGTTVNGAEVWVKKFERTLLSGASPSPFEEPFLIIIKSEDNEYTYLVDSSASVIEHRVDGVKVPAPALVPENPTALDDSVPFAIPQGFDWPSQDGIDRSEHIAIFAGGNYGHTKRLLQEAVTEAVAEILPDFDDDGIQAKDYEIGPASGAVEDFVVTLFESREALALAIGAIVDTWAVFEIVSRVRKKLQRPPHPITGQRQDDAVWMTAGTLAMLCEEFVRRNYHPRAHLTTEWYCLTREFWNGYSSPGHPNEHLEYLVLVSTSKETYRFKLLGSGKLLSHSVRRGRLDTELTATEWIADAETSSNGIGNPEA